ncbi:MAG: hypothetical protein SVO01_05780, partial [Thermotogota bacterium]|nr:hypothetical protein [Thermotogota bacterium]
LKASFKLWEEYTSEAENVFEDFLGPKTDLLYEDLLKNPHDNFKEIVRFCGIQYIEKDVLRAISTINPDRAFAFMKDKTLVEFYEETKNSELMWRLGYHEIK